MAMPHLQGSGLQVQDRLHYSINIRWVFFIWWDWSNVLYDRIICRLFKQRNLQWTKIEDIRLAYRLKIQKIGLSGLKKVKKNEVHSTIKPHNDKPRRGLMEWNKIVIKI